MGRTTEEDELDDLRANLAEDPDLADTFARLEAGKDSSGQRRSGSEFGNPLKGFVAVESAPSQRPVSSTSGLPKFHDDDDSPPDTPTRRYVKAEHPDLPDAPPSTHRNAFAPGARDPKRPPPPKPKPLPAKISSPGPMSSPRSKPGALVYGPVSSPNGAPSAPDAAMPVNSGPVISVRNASDPGMPVNSGPAISVRNTSISMPADDPVGARVTPVVGAPPTPLSPAPAPATPKSEKPGVDSGFDLAPLADSVESEQMPGLLESDSRGAAPPVAAPAAPAEEGEGSGTRLWLLIAATLVSAAATVFVLMFVVRPLSPQSGSPARNAAPSAAPTQAAAPPAQPTAVAPAPTPTQAATAADTSAAATASAPGSAPVAATGSAPASAIPGAPAVPTPGLPVAGQQPVAGAGTFVPQFSKQPPGAAPATARPPVPPKPSATATAAPKSTAVSPIFEFEK